MKSLIRKIIQIIEKYTVKETVNLIRLENFESPVIYMELCKHFSKQSGLHFEALIDVNKFRKFNNANHTEWNQSLSYLENNGYYQETMPLTSLRNKAAKQKGTTLFLLMGADTADDKGSLEDFNRISSVDMVEKLKKDYSEWFTGVLTDIDADKPENHTVLNNIFKSVFKQQNIDIMVFSAFIDKINRGVFESFEEVITFIFESLQEYWNMPSIRTEIPKVSRMKGRKAVSIIENSYRFITNTMNISPANMKKLPEKLQKYAEDMNLDISQPFENFTSYEEFCTRLTNFLKKRNIDENRQLFMNTDFGIVNKIMGLKPVKEVSEPAEPKKDKVISLSGEPLEVYLKMILHSCLKFKEKYADNMLTELVIDVKEVKLSNCISDNEADSANDTARMHYRNICNYLGGMLLFIKKKSMDMQGISFRYETESDPFDYHNYALLEGRIKKIEKWGESSQILFEVRAIGDDENIVKKSEFKWKFSPYASWKNAFSLFIKSYETDDSYKLPFIIQCRNMQDFLGCESEEEFNIKLESMQYKLVSGFTKELRNSYSGTELHEKYSSFIGRFTDWCQAMSDHGFFSCIDKMNVMINTYREMLDLIQQSYLAMTSSQQSKLALFLNCFTIVSETDYLKTLKSDKVIVPAYHPVMLEKINARNDYVIFSFSEIFEELEHIKLSEYEKRMNHINELAAITQGMDFIPDGLGNQLLCKSIWGYYAVYYRDNAFIDYISNIEFVQEEYEGNEAFNLNHSPQVRIVANQILDFLRTFPSCTDGLHICFVAPVEIQDIVAGIGQVAEQLDKNGISAVFHVKIICIGGSKNVSGYLRYWLDSYASKEKSVAIHTYLKYVQEEKVSDELPKFLQNQDIAFIYDILRTNTISFDSYSLGAEEQAQQMISCQFPMTFIPDILSSTHSSYRKVNISQVQFLVSDSYTQAAYRITNPNAKPEKYKVMQVLSLEDNQSSILNAAHELCRWVVCVDRAIDRDILQNNGNRIIGFTTGEGCFGEYNVTVSAKDDILNDIKKLLKIRLIEKFCDWKNDRAEKAAEHCIDMTRDFDGSRILKALNPYDYEIHNFLAYVLTVKTLSISTDENQGCISRTLLNLDTYRHWLQDSKKRPDFMLIEVPDVPENRDVASPIKIRIKIIECKMSIHIENHISKAVSQVEGGVETLSALWNPKSTKISRRYWYTQLYRAIAFSKLCLADSDVDYPVINAKIYDILNGNFEIEWSGDIYAYDLMSEETEMLTETIDTQCSIDTITLHKTGQLYIQKALLPEKCNEELFIFSDLNPEQAADEEEQFVSEISEISDDKQEIVQPSENTAAVPGQNLPQPSEIQDASFQQKTVNAKKELSEIRVLLGMDEKTKQKYYWEFGNPQLNNRHLLINGNSGYGKTYCIQALLMELSLQGIPSVIFDYTGGFAPDKLDSVFRDALGSRIQQRIVKMQKIPINPFARGKINLMEGVVIPEDNSDIATKISNVLATTYKFGEQQKATVYSAIMEGLEKYDENMTFDYLYEILEQISNSYAQSVMNKMRPFIDLKPFAADDTFQWNDIKNSDGMVYVIQMIGYDRPTQLMLTELLLWDLWNFAQSNGKENEPLIVVLDEAQNLNHRSSSPSGKILTEGRKFGISGWYATQFMKGQLSEDEIQCLQQASQKLYFCPPENGVMDTAKSIDISSGYKEWAERLKKLKKGECVTCGSMMRGDRWSKYEPKIIKVTSLQERIYHESLGENQQE